MSKEKMILGMRTVGAGGQVKLRLEFEPTSDLTNIDREVLRERMSGAMRGLLCSLPDHLAPDCVTLKTEES